MTPRDILLRVMRHEAVELTPWVPFAGVHAGKLAGYDPVEVLTDADKLFASLIKVNELYKPCGQPIMFDLQLEAECLGCDLLWSKASPPSVSSHPLAHDMSVPCDCKLPTERSGRIPLALDVMRRMKAAVGGHTALYGLICGPFTLASHLRGNDIFMDMYDEEDFLDGLIGFCAKAAKRLAGMYIGAGADIIAVVDPLVSQISANHFQRFLSGAFADIFDCVRGLGSLSSFFVCGDATRNIDVMCGTGPDAISVDENVDLPAAKRVTDRYNIAIGGNIPLTSVMLHGSQQDNMKCVIDLLDAVGDRRNLIVAPGCDMPYDTPVENAIAVAQALLREGDVREILKHYTAAGLNMDIELPDYANLSKPLIEVFTLDSATCAACAYMMGAAAEAAERYGEAVDLVERKYTIKENIARCKKMGVPNLPSMYINGALKFRSLIPNREELNSAIEQALNDLR